VRTVTATPLLREAAEVLEPIRDVVVVIGALAVQIALDGSDVALAVTRDVDAGVATDAVGLVVTHLERSGLRRSESPHERAFTWIRGDLKVQLLRPFHPFPPGPARGLPVSNLVGELARHRVLISLHDNPSRGCFWAADPAALVALKGAAFGRSRPSGEPVERDFSDAVVLLDRLGAEIADAVRDAPQMGRRVERVARTLVNGDAAVAAAAREMVRTGQEHSIPDAEATIRRAAERYLRRIGADGGG
jgi:hypothetical protein